MSAHIEWFSAEYVGSELLHEGDELGMDAVTKPVAFAIGDWGSSIAVFEGSHAQLVKLFDEAVQVIQRDYAQRRLRHGRKRIE